MASSLRSFAAALLFVMLFMATELGRNTKMVAEARECIEKPSGKYKGSCGSDLICLAVCKKEKMKGGHCKGPLVGAQCMCVERCF